MNNLDEMIPVITHDPLYPWSLPWVGWPTLGLVIALLVGLAIRSYLKVPGATLQRVSVVLAVRLFALVLIFLALAGTSCVSREELKVPSLVLVVVDGSESMGVKDEVDGQTRWEYMLHNLQQLQSLLERLRDKDRINVLFFRFGDEVREFDPKEPGRADAKRTDTAEALRALFEKYRNERYLRGLILLSDGADNGTGEVSPRDLARQWRALPSRLHTVVYGKKTTTSHQSDIIVRSVKTDSSVVAAKGKINLTATIDALGFVNPSVRVKLFVNGKEVEGARDVDLRLPFDNQVKLVCDAPPVPGEIKVTVKVHSRNQDGPLPGETNEANNEKSTYVTVTREGLSVLLIERQDRFPEPQMILSTLAADKRLRVHVAWLRDENEIDAQEKDLFQFEQQPYDVIILGDVRPAQLTAGDKKALSTIADRVRNRRTGLLMMGGRYAFRRDVWGGTEIEPLLPVELTGGQQSDLEPILQPHVDLKSHYLLNISDKMEPKTAWARLHPLQGFTELGKRKDTAQAILQTQGGQLILVGMDFGGATGGRSLAFAGDTTHYWVRDEESREMHSRFWRQVVLWLGRQDDTDKMLRILPDRREIQAGNKLGFALEMFGKNREELKEQRFSVKVIDPRGNAVTVPVTPEGGQFRGSFKARIPGEHRIEATGEGKNARGEVVKESTPVLARFLVEQDDAETTRVAADPDFLRELATAGGGKAMQPDDLKKYLELLPQEPLPQPPPRPGRWPDWRATRGRQPFLVAFYLLFVQTLTLEWFLRRRWGLI